MMTKNMKYYRDILDRDLASLGKLDKCMCLYDVHAHIHLHIHTHAYTYTWIGPFWCLVIIGHQLNWSFSCLSTFFSSTGLVLSHVYLFLFMSWVGPLFSFLFFLQLNIFVLVPVYFFTSVVLVVSHVFQFLSISWLVLSFPSHFSHFSSVESVPSCVCEF